MFEDEELEPCEEEFEGFDFDWDLVKLVYNRFGEIRFFGSEGLLPLGYKQFARVAYHDDFGIVYGFYIAYINRKNNKFTIRYSNSYDPWGQHFINKKND